MTKIDSVWFTTKGQVVIPAWLRKQFHIEDGTKAVVQATPLHMTDVNYAEVKYSIVKKDGAEAWEEAAKILQGLPIDFHFTTHALADTAADFKARHKISLADAFAAALAKEKKAELLTGDPEFKALEKEIKITWLK